MNLKELLRCHCLALPKFLICTRTQNIVSSETGSTWSAPSADGQLMLTLAAAFQVTTSEHIDAARLLLLVPKGGLLELRALLLERLDRHMDALRWLLPPVIIALLLICV